MSNGELAILGVAGYLAVVSFVRLLQRHRQSVLVELQAQVAAEKQKQELASRTIEAENIRDKRRSA